MEDEDLAGGAGPAPMPIVGTSRRLTISSVIAEGTASITIAKQPTDCRARASSSCLIALLALLPWAL